MDAMSLKDVTDLTQLGSWNDPSKLSRMEAGGEAFITILTS